MCKNCKSIFYYTLREISRQWVSWSGQVGSGRVRPGRFIVLSDSVSHKMVINIYLNFYRFFLKVLELFECQQSDPYMTANRNFVHFAHSYSLSQSTSIILKLHIIHTASQNIKVNNPNGELSFNLRFLAIISAPLYQKRKVNIIAR